MILSGPLEFPRFDLLRFNDVAALLIDVHFEVKNFNLKFKENSLIQ